MCDTPVLSPHPTRFPEAEDTGQKFDKVFIPKGSLMLHEMPSPGSPDGKKKQMGVSESATHLIDISSSNLDSRLCFIKPSVTPCKLSKQGDNIQP